MGNARLARSYAPAERNVYSVRRRSTVAFQSTLFVPEPEPVFAPLVRPTLTGQERRDRGVARVSSRSAFLRDVLSVAPLLLTAGVWPETAKAARLL
jgi:hypothetical protein